MSSHFTHVCNLFGGNVQKMHGMKLNKTRYFEIWIINFYEALNTKLGSLVETKTGFSDNLWNSPFLSKSTILQNIYRLFGDNEGDWLMTKQMSKNLIFEFKVFHEISHKINFYSIIAQPH